MENERFREIFADEAFFREFIALETAAEVQAALKEKGIEMTEEEIHAARDLFVLLDDGEISLEQLESGEIPEELLEKVTGGSAAGIAIIVVGCAAAVATVVIAVIEVVKTIRKHGW